MNPPNPMRDPVLHRVGQARIHGNKRAISSRGFNSRYSKNLRVQVDGRTVYSPQTAGVFWDAQSSREADSHDAWWGASGGLLEIAGQNLLDNPHLVIGTNPFIRSPAVEIQRGVYGRVTWTF